MTDDTREAQRASGPELPALPIVPAEPAEPARPAVSDVPAEPARPAVPDVPAEPAEPDVRREPAVPVRPVPPAAAPASLPPAAAQPPARASSPASDASDPRDASAFDRHLSALFSFPPFALPPVVPRGVAFGAIPSLVHAPRVWTGRLLARPYRVAGASYRAADGGAIVNVKSGVPVKRAFEEITREAEVVLGVRLSHPEAFALLLTFVALRRDEFFAEARAAWNA